MNRKGSLTNGNDLKTIKTWKKFLQLWETAEKLSYHELLCGVLHALPNLPIAISDNFNKQQSPIRDYINNFYKLPQYFDRIEFLIMAVEKYLALPFVECWKRNQAGPKAYKLLLKFFSSAEYLMAIITKPSEVAEFLDHLEVPEEAKSKEIRDLPERGKQLLIKLIPNLFAQSKTIIGDIKPYTSHAKEFIEKYLLFLPEEFADTRQENDYEALIRAIINIGSFDLLVKYCDRTDWRDIPTEKAIAFLQQKIIDDMAGRILPERKRTPKEVCQIAFRWNNPAAACYFKLKSRKWSGE